MNLEIAIVGVPALPVFKPELSAEIISEKESALAESALIGRVSNRAENDSANNARKLLREISGGLDRQRKKITEPFVEMQRLLIRIVEPHLDELKREDGRLELLVKEFTLAEQRRVREEQEVQEREIRRIESEKQAELLRIAREQAEAERKAHEAAIAAQKLIDEARNKKQRKAAEAAAAESRRLSLAAEESARQQTQIVTDQAELATQIESKPVEITRSAGQVVRRVWKISQINDFQLVRARPDLVRKIEWDKNAITEELNRGVKLPGVTAEEDIKIGTRGKTYKTIDV